VSLRGLLGANPTPTDVQLAGLVAPALTDPNYGFNAFQVGRVRTAQPYNYLTSVSTGAYSGLVAQTTDYLITAEVTGPRGARARLSQTMQYMQIPLFQFMAFYGRGVDLEIAPGMVNMTVSGRVHANSNLFIETNGTLRFDSSVTTSGHMNRYVKRDGPNGTRFGNPEIKAASGAYQVLDFDYGAKNITWDGSSSSWDPSDATYWVQEAQTRFGGKVRDGDMGVTDLLLPIPGLESNPPNPDVISHQLIERGDAGDSDALKAAKLYYQADLIIEGTKAYDQSGNEVKINDCKDSKGKKAVRKETFYDAREKVDMEVTQIDVGALTACGVMPKNGILYANPKEWKAKKGEGVRLVNGAELPSQGLTVVSESPVYIQGDYNTVNKVPAAVLADAVTALSNNWGPNDSDKKSDKATNTRPAENTTINAALALGPSAESALNQSNGHLENVIRFLEDWTGKTITYNGALLGLWHSQHATGAWRCCGNNPPYYYKAPNRAFAYDTLFNTVQPPGAPYAVLIVRGQWSQM
jgi:hypothetical protein